MGQPFSRRQLLQRASLLGACLALPARSLWAADTPRPIPWRNWSGAQSSLPAQRFAPASEEELAAWLPRAGGGVRAVGSGHSFSALVPTDGSIVSLSRLSGLIGHDPATLQAELKCGTQCGSCVPEVRRLIHLHAPQKIPAVA